MWKKLPLPVAILIITGPSRLGKQQCSTLIQHFEFNIHVPQVAGSTRPLCVMSKNHKKWTLGIPTPPFRAAKSFGFTTTTQCAPLRSILEESLLLQGARMRTCFFMSSANCTWLSPHLSLGWLWRARLPWPISLVVLWLTAGLMHIFNWASIITPSLMSYVI